MFHSCTFFEEVSKMKFSKNDWVVYTRMKHSLSPGPRAKNISPSLHGEMYSYEVDKYWIVKEVLEKDILIETRCGKQKVISLSDERLRKPTVFESIFLRKKFPKVN